MFLKPGLGSSRATDKQCVLLSCVAAVAMLVAGCSEKDGTGDTSKGGSATRELATEPGRFQTTVPLQSVILGTFVEKGVPFATDNTSGSVALASLSEIRVYADPVAVGELGGTLMVESITTHPLRLQRSPTNKYLTVELPTSATLPLSVSVNLIRASVPTPEFPVTLTELTTAETDEAPAPNATATTLRMAGRVLHNHVAQLGSIVKQEDRLKFLPMVRQIQADANRYAEFLPEAARAAVQPQLDRIRGCVESATRQGKDITTEGMELIMVPLRDEHVHKLREMGRQ